MWNNDLHNVKSFFKSWSAGKNFIIVCLPFIVFLMHEMYLIVCVIWNLQCDFLLHGNQLNLCILFHIYLLLKISFHTLNTSKAICLQVASSNNEYFLSVILTGLKSQWYIVNDKLHRSKTTLVLYSKSFTLRCY